MHNMDHKKCSVSLVFLVAMLCVCRIDLVKASIVTTEKSFTQEAYSKHGFRKGMMSGAIQDTSSRWRRSIQEQGDSGHEDVCAGMLLTPFMHLLCEFTHFKKHRIINLQQLMKIYAVTTCC